jgi:hypothetical protein
MRVYDGKRWREATPEEQAEFDAAAELAERERLEDLEFEARWAADMGDEYR